MVTHINKLKGKYYVSTTAPTTPKEGDRWFDTSTGTLFQYVSSAWVGHRYTSTSSSTTTTTTTSTSSSTTSTSSSTSSSTSTSSTTTI